MKKISFELTRVLDNGKREEPQIVPVEKMPWEDVKTNRRGFLGAGMAVSVALMLLKAEKSQGNSLYPHIEQQGDSSCKDIFAHKSSVQALSVSPDGKFFLSGGADGMVKLWGLPDGALIKTFEAHKLDITALAISPEEAIFASGSSDKTVKLWSLPDGKRIANLEGHKAGIKDITFSIDGKRLISTALDNSIKIWNVRAKSMVEDLECTGQCLSLAMSPEGDYISTGFDDKTIKIWSFPEFELVQTLTGHSGDVFRLAYGQDGSVMASACTKGEINLWREEASLNLIKNNRSCNALAIHTGEQVLIGGGDDLSIRLWDLQNDTLIKKIDSAHTSSINALAITPDGRFFISAGSDKRIKIWKLSDGSFITCLMDLACCSASTKGITFKQVNEYGQTITYTLPCGSPIPPGATCTCNCVPGSIPLPKPSTPSYGGSCTCNKVCTCVPISY